MTDIEINKLIELHDKTLNELRLEWEHELDPKKKRIVMNRIDRALDYRLKLMASRDAEDNEPDVPEIKN